jgi:hypothetical protein
MPKGRSKKEKGDRNDSVPFLGFQGNQWPSMRLPIVLRPSLEPVVINAAKASLMSTLPAGLTRCDH